MSLASRFEVALPAWIDAFVDGWGRPLESEADCMALAIALSAENVMRGTGGPFGAVVSDERTGQILGVGVNVVTAAGISLAHAEMVALSLASPATADKIKGKVRIDGSSTVFPITEAVAEEYRAEQPKVRVTVGFSGTGGGFKKFLVGETDKVLKAPVTLWPAG